MNTISTNIGIFSRCRITKLLGLMPLLCLLLGVLTLHCCQADTPQRPAAPNLANVLAPTAPPADRVTLDYTPSSTGQLIIWVWLNGRTPARFVLDTGATYCCISDTVAAKIGLTPRPAVNEAGSPVTSDGTQAEMVNVPTLQVGTISFLKIPMISVNGRDLSELSDARVDGILGVMALTSYPIFIDFQKHQATFFYTTPVADNQLRSLGMESASSVPLADYDGNLNFQSAVQLASGTKKALVRLTVDTGGTHTIIPELPALSLRLKLGSKHSYGGLVSEALVSDVTLPSVSFGSPGTEVNGVEAECARGKVPDSFPLRVGLDVLSHFQVLIDFGGKKMYLKPVTAPSVPLFVPSVPVKGK